MVFDVNVSERAGIDLESSQPKIENDRSRALDETGQLAQIPNTALLELISSQPGARAVGWAALGRGSWRLVHATWAQGNGRPMGAQGWCDEKGQNTNPARRVVSVEKLTPAKPVASPSKQISCLFQPESV
jgi:hypothetical protein